MASEKHMTPTDAAEGIAASYDSVDESVGAAHVGDEESNNGEENAKAALPSLETMEDLIIEAYNNMQSDGEHIFLPEEVVSKLRLLAQMKNAEYSSDDVVSQSSESNQEELPRSLIQPAVSNIHSAASSTPSSPPPREPVGGALLHDVSALSLDDNNAVEVAYIDSTDEEQKPSEIGAFEMRIDTAAPIVEAEYVAALSPVEEVSEDVLSIDDLHFDPEPSQDTLSPSPAKSVASPSEKPVSRLRKPEVQRRRSIIPAAPRSLTKTQIPNKPAATPKAVLAASQIKAEAAPSTSRERSSSSYEQRREAAQKLKEEKAQRELQARESARKQREDARRKLEEAQQKEMAAKRERVARMKMQKDTQRKTPAGTTKTTTAR